MSEFDLTTASGRRLQKLCCGEDGAPIQLSTDVLYFAHTPVGSISAWLPLIIQNDSDEKLTISSYSLDGDFEHENTVTSVSAGSSAVIKVRFKPTTEGLRMGNLQIMTDAPGFAPNVKLVGVGGDEVTVSDIDILHARLGDVEGTILTERSIRLTKDTALARLIEFIGVESPDGNAFILDSSTVYVSPTESFAERLETISSTLGANTASIETERSTRTTAFQAQATVNQTLTASVGAARASIEQEAYTRAQNDSAIAGTVEEISVSLGDGFALILEEQSARIDGDEATAEIIQLLGSQSADYSAFILNTLTTRVTPTMTLAAKFEQLVAEAGENAQAMITEESEVRADAEGALAGRITTIEANYVTTAAGTALVNAKVAEEALARSTKDDALAARITTIEASYVTTTGANNIASTVATAKVGDEALARSNADLALAGRITTIETTYITTTAAANQATTIANAKVADEASTRSTADLALSGRITTIEASYVTTTGANTIATTIATAKVADEALARAEADLALSNRTTTIESVIGHATTGLGNAHARITTESSTRVTALANEVTARNDAIGTAIGAEVIARNSAIATEITRVETRIDNNVATITQHASSLNGLQARYGVALDVNGHVIGFVANNNGTSGTFDIVADKFRVAMPGANPVQIFSVTSDGVRINGNLIVNGTIYSNQLGNGAMGEAAMTYDETNLAVNTQGTFSNVSSVTIQSKHGKPMKIDFTTFARCTNDNSTRLRVRVVRSDGVVVYGGPYGSEIRINDEGTPVCIRAISSSTANTTYTFTLQAVKSVNNETVNFGFRMAYVEEMSRVNWQSITINTAATGSDPGSGGYTGGSGGDGGGGDLPSPGEYDPDLFDGGVT